MVKRNKIMIAVIADLLLLVAAVCAFGFTIGGKPKLLYILYAAVCSIVLSYLSIILIKGKACDKGSSFLQSLVILAIVSTACMYLTYNAINAFAADSQYKEYETTVEYFTSTDRILGSSVGFYNQAGELVETSDYNAVWTDDESVPAAGAELTIREYNGAFNYPKYEIAKVNGREEK